MNGLSFANVTVCYGKAPAVHHVNANIPRGALTALVGPNGAGKSTLLRAILGLHPLTTGSITLDLQPSAMQLERITYLPQRSAIDWDFPLRVRDLVATGRYRRLGFARGFGADDRAAVDAAIYEMGLRSLQDRHINALSGGQQQRALLARALASGADVFLLDEPFAGLDQNAADDLVDRLSAWAQQGRLTLAAVHDLAMARSRFSHAMVLRNHLVACGPVDQALAPVNVAAAFARTMVAVSTV